MDDDGAVDSEGFLEGLEGGEVGDGGRVSTFLREWEPVEGTNDMRMSVAGARRSFQLRGWPALARRMVLSSNVSLSDYWTNYRGTECRIESPEAEYPHPVA